MFTKEERLFIWKMVYDIIDRSENGEYICIALKKCSILFFQKT